jgi:small GTP-binding protein
MNNVKIVLVGDDAVGKTSLAITYSTGEFPRDYIPTVTDNIETTQVYGGEGHSISVWDSAGSVDYDRLRPLSYPQTDIFLVCFSVSNRDSFDSVAEKWVPEISHHTPDAKWVLVGTKSDLRSEHGVVTPEEAQSLVERLKGSDYVECSSLNQSDLSEVFEKAIAAVTAKPKKKGFFSRFRR